jgi:hypothetical protein
MAKGRAMRAATGTKMAAMYHHSRPGVFILPYCQVVRGGSEGVVEGAAAGCSGAAMGAGAAGVVSAVSVARAMVGARRAGSSAAGVRALLVLTPLVLAAPDASRRDEDVRAAIFCGGGEENHRRRRCFSLATARVR